MTIYNHSLTVAFLEKLLDKKVFSSLELYFVRLKKQKAVICGKEDDNYNQLY